MAKRKTLNTAPPDDNWMVESDLRTMIECEAIEKDPKRLAKVQALAKKRMVELGGIASEGRDAS